MTELYFSLRQIYPKKYEVPITLSASIILLICGLLLPAITLKELIIFKSTFSILTGIQNLFKEKHALLGIVIILFSIIFPIFKLSVLSVVWCGRLSVTRRQFLIHWLGILGKWSMLDVFVVAVTIVITKISGLAKAEPRIGIYLFGVSVILAMMATERIERLMVRVDKKEKGENIQDESSERKVRMENAKESSKKDQDEGNDRSTMWFSNN